MSILLSNNETFNIKSNLTDPNFWKVINKLVWLALYIVRIKILTSCSQILTITLAVAVSLWFPEIEPLKLHECTDMSQDTCKLISETSTNLHYIWYSCVESTSCQPKMLLCNRTFSSWYSTDTYFSVTLFFSTFRHTQWPQSKL